MTSRRIPFDDGPNPCQCKNLCSRTGSKRGACPCLAAEAYCTDLCTCGVDRLQCTNKYGHGGPLDMILGVHEASGEDEEKDDEIVLLVGHEDGHAHVHLGSDDLNRTIQDEADSQFEAHGTIDTSWVQQKGNEPLSEGMDVLSGLAVPVQLSLLKLIVTKHPEMMAYLTNGHGPNPPPVPPNQEPLGWCHCSRCDQMPRPEEQKCCRRRNGPCVLITAAAAINAVILNVDVLAAAIHNRNDLFALADDINNNRCLRHTAYRQYVLWRFGHLGAGNRVVIPSCVVMEIRRKFPSPENQYTGFRLNRFD